MSHYKSYADYKDSGVEWQGMVPKHWVTKKVLHWISGYGSGTTPSDERDYCDVSEGVAWVTTGELREKTIYETEKYVTHSALSSYSALKKHPTGSLVIAMYGATIGRIGILGREATLNQACFAIHPCAAMDLSFLRYWFEGFRKELVELGTGAGQPNISAEKIRNLVISAPSAIREQRLIAEQLDHETTRIDALVEKKSRFIEFLREKRQATITHAVIKGVNPNAPMKDSGVEWLGEVPEHWVVKRLKFIARVQTGVAKGKDLTDKDTIEVPYLRVANVQDGFLDLDEVATIEINATDLERYLLQPGDVLMNEGGDYDKLGRGHVWSGEISPCIHQNHVFAVRPHGVGSSWLNAFTSSAAAQFYFMGKSKQSTNLASISSSNLMELPVPVPPEQEQLEILAKVRKNLEKLDDVVRRTERSIELLKEHRSALLTAAVTGQIDLRDTAVEASQIEMRKTA